MRKPFIISVATAAFLILGQAAPNLSAHAQAPITIKAGQEAKVTADSLNIRSTPSTRSSVIGTFKQGKVILVKNVTNGWAEVSYNNKPAYVSATYLQPVTVPGQKGVVTASTLNVRTAPSTSGKVIGSVKKNATVIITKKLSNGWIEISYQGKAAYVSGQYVTEGIVPKPQPSQLSAYEQKVVELTNAERTKYGLPALTVDTQLSKVARMKSEDMYKQNYFNHTSPTYGSPFDMMHSNSITYRMAGENIAMGQPTPEEVVKAWMNSPGHRANILKDGYTSIGVGYVASQNIWTQEFIGK
ncbi:SH3 domain-containing protein [Microbacteriaceae bacterium 4G12]